MSCVHEHYRDHFPGLPAELDLRLNEDKSTPLGPQDAKAFGDFGLRAFLDRALEAATRGTRGYGIAKSFGSFRPARA